MRVAGINNGNAPHKVEVQILQGDCLEQLKMLPSCSVQSCVTSPPYWSQRCYETAPQIWGGVSDCKHVWVKSPAAATKLSTGGNTQGEYGGGHVDHTKVYANSGPAANGEFCARCGAWAGELGLEPAPGQYVTHLVQIFREVRRVLRDDGTLFLNLGDTFVSKGKKTGRNDAGRRNDWGEFGDGEHRERHAGGERVQIHLDCDLPAGNLVGIPWRVAFGLQDDGWILRSDTIWHKPSPMPESVKNRPTRAHEYVFIFAKTNKYYYDADAVREPCVSGNGRPQGLIDGKRAGGQSNAKGTVSGFGERLMINPKLGRNARDVLTIASQPYRGAHCAPMPPRLAAWCIAAGTSAGAHGDPNPSRHPPVR